MSAAIPRKPVPKPAAAHLKSGDNVNSTSSIRLVTTEDRQDAPSSVQTKEIDVGMGSEDVTSSGQLTAPSDQRGESKLYEALHQQGPPTNLQTKEMEMGMASGETVSSSELSGDEQGKRKRYGTGALGCLAGIKSSTFVSTLCHHFNNYLPPQRRYLKGRISRRTLLIMIAITFISLLALIIGLAVGLPNGSQYVWLSPLHFCGLTDHSCLGTTSRLGLMARPTLWAT